MALRGTFHRAAGKFIQLPRIKHLEFKTGRRVGRYHTPQLRRTRVTGTKPTRADVARLRKEFYASDGPRDKFLAQVRAKATVAELQARGWTAEEIRIFKAGGNAPEGFAVHHRIPLQGGGTNNPDNFILIKNDPDHDLITASQNAVLQRIPEGAPMNVDVPVMPPGLWTWPQPGTHAYRER